MGSPLRLQMTFHAFPGAHIQEVRVPASRRSDNSNETRGCRRDAAYAELCPSRRAWGESEEGS